MSNDAQHLWEQYKKRELVSITPLLKSLGYTLDENQPHTIGERYLMQAVTTTSGKKLILLGQRAHDKQRAVIKITSDADGARELASELACRRVLHTVNFAHGTFLLPEELLYTKHAGYTISIQAFIEHKRPFLELPIKEQFTLALKAFKVQESARATTNKHERLIGKTFGIRNATQYIKLFNEFITAIHTALPNDTKLHTTLKEALAYLHAHQKTIDQYGGFLTHTDFVPHNFRVVGNDLYLLDHSSLRFGNKYEGWARFLNFMTLYNPELEHALVAYVRANRTPEESLSLKLMRVYRLGEIIRYYADTINKCTGNLYALNLARVAFWSEVLTAILHNQPIAEQTIREYRQRRDELRSEDEKQRQKGLH